MPKYKLPIWVTLTTDKKVNILDAYTDVADFLTEMAPGWEWSINADEIKEV